MLWTDGFVFVFEDSRLTAARQANDGHKAGGSLAKWSHGLMMTRPSSITCQVLHTSDDDQGDGGDELNSILPSPSNHLLDLQTHNPKYSTHSPAFKDLVTICQSEYTKSRQLLCPLTNWSSGLSRHCQLHRIHSIHALSPIWGSKRVWVEIWWH